MLEGDARDIRWLLEIPETEKAAVIMEGVSMYIKNEELCALTAALNTQFCSLSLLIDCYSEFAAKMSRYKNPVNEVGVTKVYGLDNPLLLENGGLRFMREHEITPDCLINKLKAEEKLIFRKLYGGSLSKRLYGLYEYEKI